MMNYTQYTNDLPYERTSKYQQNFTKFHEVSERKSTPQSFTNNEVNEQSMNKLNAHQYNYSYSGPNMLCDNNRTPSTTSTSCNQDTPSFPYEQDTGFAGHLRYRRMNPDMTFNKNIEFNNFRNNELPVWGNSQIHQKQNKKKRRLLIPFIIMLFIIMIIIFFMFDNDILSLNKKLENMTTSVIDLIPDWKIPLFNHKMFNKQNPIDSENHETIKNVFENSETHNVISNGLSDIIVSSEIETNTIDIPAIDTPVQIPIKEIPIKEVPTGEIPMGEIPMGEIPMGEIPMERIPTKDNTVQNSNELVINQ